MIAGGTDFYPARVERPADEDVLDISGLGELRRIKAMPRYFRIGAGVTWSDLMRADLPRSFDGLKLAAREIGGIQIQNTGTIAGNICNASPAADSLPNLLALDTRGRACLGSMASAACRSASSSPAIARRCAGPTSW